MPVFLAMLLAADPEPAEEQPFLDSGGVNLVFVQSLHGLFLGPAIYLSGNNNTSEATSPLLAPAVLVPVVYLAFGLAAGHWLRPSIVTTYESALLGVAGLLAGFAVADAYVEGRRPKGFNLNWLWPTRLIAGAVGHLVGSAVALVPRQVDPPGWHTWAAMGSVVIGVGVIIGLLSSQPSTEFDPTISWAYAMPFALGCATSVLLRALLPESRAQIAPVPLDHGAGVSIGTRW